MLQNLANKPSYAKEAYMMTLNPFVENNKARINQFLNNLCEVGDFYDTLEVGGSSLCSIAYLIRVSDGSIYGTFEERSPNPNYIERALQHSFASIAAHRHFGDSFGHSVPEQLLMLWLRLVAQ